MPPYLRAASLAGAIAIGAALGVQAGQERAPQALDAAARRRAVEALADVIDRNYVLPEVASALGKHLRTALAAGAYDASATADALARQLTSDLQSWSRDRHLRVVTSDATRSGQVIARGSPPPGRGGGEPIVVIETGPGRGGPPNFGFARVEILDGNIGYLDLRGFRPEPAARDTASAAMAFVAHSRAVIIDLRRNGGGSPDMVRYLASYFFDDTPVLLNRFFDRPSNTATEQTTIDVPGTRMPHVPLYILTSGRTFSAAEAFSYSLQALKRATVVGEVTGGGAHPTVDMPVTPDLVAVVPVARSINPVTGTDWEGVGVQPDIRVPAGDALDRALDEARKRIGS